MIIFYLQNVLVQCTMITAKNESPKSNRIALWWSMPHFPVRIPLVA